MSEQSWLEDAVKSIVDRLIAEGAEGVIVAVAHDDAKVDHFQVRTDGMLCLMDGLKLSNAICQTLGESILKEGSPEIALPTPEARQ